MGCSRRTPTQVPFEELIDGKSPASNMAASPVLYDTLPEWFLLVQ